MTGSPAGVTRSLVGTEPADPVRVLHVITRMVIGGAQENTLATVRGLQGNGWDSSLAAGPAGGPEGNLEPRCREEGIRFLQVPELVRELSPRLDRAAYGRLVALFRKERPHVVHTHTSKAGILGRLAARRAGVPIVIHTPHGHVFHGYESRLRTRVFVAAERFCARLSDRLVALTDTERREHLEQGIGREDQWVTAHSGIDFRPFQAAWGAREEVRRELGLSPRDRVIGTVGRLVPVKGQCHLLDAFSRACGHQKEVRLLLVGDGPLREELMTQCRTLRLAVISPGTAGARGSGPAVQFLGLRSDVPRLLAAMDLFVLPSLNEGMGRVLVEAMAMELACVASRVSGIPDVVVDGVTGLLVPPADAGALAAALTALLEDPERAARMGRAGRSRVIPDFGREAMIERLAAVYAELLQVRGLPVPPGLVPAAAAAGPGRRMP